MRSFLLIFLITGFITSGITGCDRIAPELMTDPATPTEMMPTMDDPEAFTVAFVQAAIDLYKAEGAEATATYYNDPANIEG
ncbi:hypothetical protein J5I95_08970, partial [Candidatus Poribacteria bacterium]|nr:hypothetical protein [Candidatus Poribacteria bacterium]